jgi:hypothetical protein
MNKPKMSKGLYLEMFAVVTLMIVVLIGGLYLIDALNKCLAACF